MIRAAVVAGRPHRRDCSDPGHIAPSTRNERPAMFHSRIRAPVRPLVGAGLVPLHATALVLAACTSALAQQPAPGDDVVRRLESIERRLLKKQGPGVWGPAAGEEICPSSRLPDSWTGSPAFGAGTAHSLRT